MRRDKHPQRGEESTSPRRPRCPGRAGAWRDRAAARGRRRSRIPCPARRIRTGSCQDPVRCWIGYHRVRAERPARRAAARRDAPDASATRAGAPRGGPERARAGRGAGALVARPRAGPRRVAAPRRRGLRAAGRRGLLVSRHGAFTFVAETAGAAARIEPASEPRPPRFDFFPGVPDLFVFPRAALSWGARDVLRTLPDHQLGYTDPHGAAVLRTQLAEYVSRARGVDAAPERVVVVSGASQGLALLTRLLVRRGTPRIAVEDPSLPVHPEAARAQRGRAVPGAGRRGGDPRRRAAEAAPRPRSSHPPTRCRPASPFPSTAARPCSTGPADGGLVVEDYGTMLNWATTGRCSARSRGSRPSRSSTSGRRRSCSRRGCASAGSSSRRAASRRLAVEKLLHDMGTEVIAQHARSPASSRAAAVTTATCACCAAATARGATRSSPGCAATSRAPR